MKNTYYPSLLLVSPSEKLLSEKVEAAVYFKDPVEDWRQSLWLP